MTTSVFVGSFLAAVVAAAPATSPDPAIDEAEALRRMADAPSVAWIEDGTLYAAVRAPDAEAVFVLAAVQESLTELETPGLWGGAFVIDRADEAAMSCGFGVRSATSFERVHDTPPLRGVRARPAPESVESIRGSVTIHEFESEALGAKRPLHVYMPPAVAPADIEQVVFMADGQGTDRYATVLEPLVTSGAIPPTAIVGVAADTSGGAGDPSTDYRGMEYLVRFSEIAEGADPGRFDRHWTFFTEEVPAWVDATLGIRVPARGRIVAGSSNGGAFAATVAARRPEAFGASIVLSSGWLFLTDEFEPLPDGHPGHRAFFSGGTLEPGFLEQTRAAHAAADGAGYTTTLDERVGGHDPLIWREQFVAGLRWIAGVEGTSEPRVDG